MSKTALIGISIIILIGCKQKIKDVLPYYNDPSFTTLFLSEQEADQQIKHHIDSFQFTDQNGETFSSDQLDGKIHVANFFFTGCGSICPGMMDKLSAVQKKFNDPSVIFLSFSVTPWSDSVPRLKAYASLRNIDASNWKLLTGNTRKIYEIARRSYFAEESLGFNKDSSNFLHTEHVLLMDKNKRIRGIYNGTLQLDMQQLEKDISILQNSH